MEPKDLPVGYWIRTADELLTKGIDQIQSEFGLTRTAWQILNTIRERSEIQKAALTNLLQHFADSTSIEKVLTAFEQEGLTQNQGSGISLTAKGHRTHRDCLAQQSLFRQRCMQHISDQEYQTLVATLKKLVANLSE